MAKKKRKDKKKRKTRSVSLEGFEIGTAEWFPDCEPTTYVDGFPAYWIDGKLVIYIPLVA